MKKFKVPIPGTIGKSVKVETGLEPRVSALEAALAALKKAGNSKYHNTLLGLQVGNDHPQYPLKLGRETIKGQWDFTKQIWASFGDEDAPGYAFTGDTGTGFFGSFTAGDPYFSSVVALLHFNGADEGSVFTDSSSYARTVGALIGSPVTDQDQKKYGNASLRVPSGAYLGFNDAPELRIPTGDWTVETWMYRSAGSLLSIGKNNVGGAGTTIWPLNLDMPDVSTLRMQCADGAGSGVVNIVSLAAPAVGSWFHVACVRSGSTFYMFIDGILQGTATYAGTLGENAFKWYFTSNTNDGWFDDFRFTVGVARYTEDFTPPTTQMPDAGDVSFVSVTVDQTERFRFMQDGQLGIGGASYGTLRQSFLSGGPSAPPTWSTLVHTDISDWDEAVMDTVAANLDDTSSVVWDYGDSDGSLKAFVPAEYVQDVVGAMAIDSTTVDFTYDDTAGTLSAAVIALPAAAFANPSASVGLTAVNGSATTAMRSDAAPALSQSIAPTWTGNHIFSPASGNTKIHTGNLYFDADNLELQLGAGTGSAGDLRLFHDGTNSFIRNDTGALRLTQGTTVALDIPSGSTLVSVYPGVSGGGAVAVDASNTNTADFRMTQGQSNRWIFRKTGTSETGSNAGSDFAIVARDDSGASLGNCFTITRSTRRVDMTVAGAGFADGDATLPGWCFTGDTNNGAYRIGTDNWAMTAGGVKQLELGATFTAQATQARMTGIISPTQLVANTDNWNPTGLSTANVIRANVDAARNITGIVAQAGGTLILLQNTTTFTITLVHDATSTAANRFLCPGAANFSLTQKNAVWIWYDATAARWQVVS